ncbi:hypothetical protein [Nocardia brasiliensis]|uniref:hypothetical protein n=1 Tax=Nocardia brasiliensis TaxID=37326 RepID=UPI0004A76938|nr:hypothetical protein [Nocardia brasiliensis]
MTEVSTTPPAEPTPLERALARACEFAIAHDVAEPITPADFGIQRSDTGLTTATYVDADHAVTVTVDRHGEARIAVAELSWIHNEADSDRDCCDFCEYDLDDLDNYGPPMHDVYLPGDAPAEASHGV